MGSDTVSDRTKYLPRYLESQCIYGSPCPAVASPNFHINHRAPFALDIGPVNRSEQEALCRNETFARSCTRACHVVPQERTCEPAAPLMAARVNRASTETFLDSVTTRRRYEYREMEMIVRLPMIQIGGSVDSLEMSSQPDFISS